MKRLSFNLLIFHPSSNECLSFSSLSFVACVLIGFHVESVVYKCVKLVGQDDGCSPLSVVLLSPEFVVGLIHEHAVLEEHDVHEPPEEEDEWDREEKLPVGPREHCDEDAYQEEVEQGALRWCVPHFINNDSFTNKLL